MLRIANLSLPLTYTPADLAAQIARKLKLPVQAIGAVTLVKKSVDARDKGDVHFVITADAQLKDEAAVLRRLKPGIAERVTPPAAKPLPRP